MPGRFVDDGVLVDEQSEANRIYNKGRFGRPVSGGGLRLGWVEAAYLVETGRLALGANDPAQDWSSLVTAASRADPGFEVQFLAYRDHRERGALVLPPSAAEAKDAAHFRHWDRASDAAKAPNAWIYATSERTPFAFGTLWSFAAQALKRSASPRVTVVDEESDVTHYELGIEAPKGRIDAGAGSPAAGVLLADRILVEPGRAAEQLHEHEFFGKPVGPCLQLSLVEGLYLANAGRLTIADASTGKPLALAALRRRLKEIEPLLELRLRVFEDLKARGLIVKTGYKFGTHFRAYEASPHGAHAPFLVQAVAPGFSSPWEPIARAVRLAHTVRKRFFLAEADAKEVRYLGFGRLR